MGWEKQVLYVQNVYVHFEMCVYVFSIRPLKPRRYICTLQCIPGTEDTFFVVTFMIIVYFFANPMHLTCSKELASIS